MSLGIEYDAKFAMLINRLLVERRKFDMAYQTHDNLSYLSQKDMSDKLLSIAHNMDERAETTLKHIYKYINKHVEREIEKARKDNQVDKETPCCENNRDRLFFIDPNGLSGTEKNSLISHLKHELKLINPLILALPNLEIDGSYSAPNQFCITLEFSQTPWQNDNCFGLSIWRRFNQFSEVDSFTGMITLNLTDIAKNFANKISLAVEKYYAPE